MVKKKFALWVLVLVFLLVFNSCKNEKNKGFNIVLIVIDALRSDHLPFYGYEKDTAPFLWELSKKSVLFENAFSTSSRTSPAAASIFTSMYPFQHGVLMVMWTIKNARKIDPTIEINRIPGEIETITEMLKKNGYRTYGVSDNINIGHEEGFTQGFDQFKTFMYRQAPAVNRAVKKWKKELTSGGKYFLYLHYMDPHEPYYPREPWYKPHKEERKSKIAAYDSEINFVDRHIRELFKEFQWDKNTLVIITSDHGEGLWDHGVMGHGSSLFREEIQVPFLIYLPGSGSGLRISANVSTLDILPTVRDLMGLPGSKNDEGVSLVPLIENRKSDLGRRYLYSYLWLKALDANKPRLNEVEFRTTIYKKWHFMIKFPGARHLYSLLLDKKEEENKFTGGKTIARQLEIRFNDFMKSSKKYKQKTAAYKLDRKKSEKLKTLGYVH